MENLLQEIADGRAEGWRRWYALFHAARCYRCGTFLKRLQATVLALRETKSHAVDSDAIARLKGRLKDL
jgi:hypothetical protein